MINISLLGAVINITASNTFPSGFNVSQFADDGDGIDLPSQTIIETAMGANGDLVGWEKVSPIKLTLHMLPMTEDDKNLGILLEANRASRGKRGARDVITMTIVEPSGKKTTLFGGFITDGVLGNSFASAGRAKSKDYGFSFEGRSTS